MVMRCDKRVQPIAQLRAELVAYQSALEQPNEDGELTRLLEDCSDVGRAGGSRWSPCRSLAGDGGKMEEEYYRNAVK